MSTRLIKVAEATGPALDWLVATIEHRRIHGVQMVTVVDRDVGWLGRFSHRYSTDWAQGGPIIEREGIYLWRPYGALGAWSAKLDDWPNERVVHADTSLIAAMRCYVISKLGPEVEVPEELLT